MPVQYPFQCGILLFTLLLDVRTGVCRPPRKVQEIQRSPGYLDLSFLSPGKAIGHTMETVSLSVS